MRERKECSCPGVHDDRDDDVFFTKRKRITIRVLLVCYARGLDFRAGGKIVFLADLARFCVSNVECRMSNVEGGQKTP